MNKRALGTEYESRAAAYLTENGYRVLERNYRCKKGEIDLIAREKRYLVFLEVKYRSSSRDGTAAQAVDIRKQNRIIGAAKWYLMEHHLPENQPCRFDVIAIDGSQITLIKDAFWS